MLICTNRNVQQTPAVQATSISASAAGATAAQFKSKDVIEEDMPSDSR